MGSKCKSELMVMVLVLMAMRVVMGKTELIPNGIKQNGLGGDINQHGLWDGIINQHGLGDDIINQHGLGDYINQTDLGDDILNQRGLEDDINNKHGLGNDTINQDGLGDDIINQHGLGTDINQNGLGPDINQTDLGDDILSQRGLEDDIINQYGLGVDINQDGLRDDIINQHGLGVDINQRGLRDYTINQHDLGFDIDQHGLGDDIDQRGLGDDIINQDGLGDDIINQDGLGDDMINEHGLGVDTINDGGLGADNNESKGNDVDEIWERLEKAREKVEKANSEMQESHPCQPQLSQASSSLTWAQAQLLQGHVAETSRQVADSRALVSACRDMLALPRKEEGSLVGASVDVDELVKEVVERLDDVASLITSRIASHGKAKEEGSNVHTTQGGSGSCGSIPDGTKCQFNSCGQGRHLPYCAMGFASGVIGGAKGHSYIVTRNDDNPANPQFGTLRYGISLGGYGGGVWITFAHSMIIVLHAMLWVKSFTTIDGRGANITLNGKMLVLGGVSNVILHNLQINNMGESDTVHIFARSSKVWVDHLTSFNAKLGLVSVVQGSTDVTISNCFLSNYNFNMLLGASDMDFEDRGLRVTVYRNWFKDSMQRMPHCRRGYCHVINNLYTNWGYYAIGARAHASILSEGNVFISSRRSEVTPWFPGAKDPSFDFSSVITSKNDLLLNGSTFHQFSQFGTTKAPLYRSRASYPPMYHTTRLPILVQNCAGALFGLRLRYCLFKTR